MRVKVKVTPRAKMRSIQTTPDGVLVVRLPEPAEAGRANAALIQMLAEHFGVPKKTVTILQGQTSRQKLVEIATQ